MRRNFCLLFVILGFFLAGCASKPSELPVRTQYPKDIDFSTLKSFRPGSSVAEEAHAYPKFQQMARQVVAEELETRGYERLEDGTPDFRVRAHLRFTNYATKKLGTSPTTGEPIATKSDLRNVTLIVEMLSPVEDRVIWQGTVSGFQLDPFKPRTDLKSATWRLFVEFPPLW